VAFDFPNSPSEGTVFAPTGGPVYVYTGGVWKMQGSGQVVTAEARNRIVNPAMQISQENGDTRSGAAGVFCADQWGALFSTATSSIGHQRMAVTTPRGSTYRYSTDCVTAKPALAATDYWLIRHSIEGIRTADFLWGTASARQAVLRFGFRGPAGTYVINLRSGPTPATRSYSAAFTVTTSNVDQEFVLVIPGDTAGTWVTDTAMSMFVDILLAAGSTVQSAVPGWQAGNVQGLAGMSNGMATAGNTFHLYDVGLYLDPNATGVPPPWQMPDEAQELAACMRYYEIGGATWDGFTAGLNVLWGVVLPFKVSKRIAPAMSASNAAATNFSAAINFGALGGAVGSHGSYGAKIFHQVTVANVQGGYNDNWVANARM